MLITLLEMPLLKQRWSWKNECARNVLRGSLRPSACGDVDVTEIQVGQIGGKSVQPSATS